MKAPLEKIIDHAKRRVEEEIELDHAVYVACYLGVESPIEQLMLTAIRTVIAHGGVEQTYSFQDRYHICKGSNAPFAGEPFLVIEPQAKILNYIADFLIYVPIGKGISRILVVECDGHDYHERTADQAEHDRVRDRKMQEAGYTVFRFTGREIYRDPIKCAEQVLAWAEERAVFE